MQRSRFTVQQIAIALQQAEEGTQVGEVAGRMGISGQTFYRFRLKRAPAVSGFYSATTPLNSLSTLKGGGSGYRERDRYGGPK